MKMNVKEQIDALCNGELTMSEQQKLIQCIQEEPEYNKQVWDQLRLHEALSIIMGDRSFDTQAIKSVLASLEDRKRTKQCISKVTEKISQKKKFILKKRKKSEKSAKQHLKKVRLAMCIAASLLIMASSFLLMSEGSLFSSKQSSIGTLTFSESGISIRRQEKAILAKSSMDIYFGDLIFSGENQSATITFNDKSTVSVNGNSKISFRKNTSGKDVFVLDQGSITAVVSRQSASQPMLFKTPQATVKILGTVFNLSTSDKMTNLNVTEGVVRIDDNENGNSLNVKEGFSAKVSESGSIKLFQKKFILGVNINGPAVTINGNSWLSQKQALENGLRTNNVRSRINKDLALNPAVNADVANMLNRCYWIVKDELQLQQSIKNGTYEVYIWMVENFEDNYRTINVNLEGIQVANNIGSLPLASWKRYGPYSVDVNDEELNLALSSGDTEPHIMGLEVYQIIYSKKSTEQNDND